MGLRKGVSFLSWFFLFCTVYTNPQCLSHADDVLPSHVWFFVNYSPPGSSVHGDFPSKNIGVDCHTLLQGIFPMQGLNPGLPYCRWILYHLSHQGSPRILDWVAYLFSRVTSWPRNWTGVSCIADRFFATWATREASCSWKSFAIP